MEYYTPPAYDNLAMDTLNQTLIYNNMDYDPEPFNPWVLIITVLSVAAIFIYLAFR